MPDRPTPRQRDHDHGPTAQLLEELWCVTCDHSHIGTIPSTTFRCDGDEEGLCGFGCWGASVAGAHAERFPTHVVYPLVHVTVPISWRESVLVDLAMGDRVATIRHRSPGGKWLTHTGELVDVLKPGETVEVQVRQQLADEWEPTPFQCPRCTVRAQHVHTD